MREPRTARRRLHPHTVASIKEDIAAGYGQTEIARRHGCSIGAVQTYIRSDRAKRLGIVLPHAHAYAKRPKMVEVHAPPAKPNMLPWMTVDMLMGRRAPVAKVRS